MTAGGEGRAGVALVIAALWAAPGCGLFLDGSNDGDGDGDAGDVFGLPQQSQRTSETNVVLVDLADEDGLFVAVVTQQATPSSAIGVSANTAPVLEIGREVSGGHSVQLFFTRPQPGEITVTAEFSEAIPSIVTAIPVAGGSDLRDFAVAKNDGIIAPATVTASAGPEAFVMCAFAGTSDRDPVLTGGSRLWRTAFSGAFGDAQGRTLGAATFGSGDVTVEFLAAWVVVCATPTN